MQKKTKRCSMCLEEKSVDDFYVVKATGKLRSNCKLCCNATCRRYKRNNKDKIKAYNKRYKEENKEAIRKQVKEYHQTDEYKEKRKARRNKKRRNVPKENINHRMEVAIRQSLQDSKNGRKWESLVGYTAKDLKEHLESLFQEGMTWKKFLNGEIHIDHIKPKAMFSYKSHKDKSFKQCWSLDNLQPLWAEENLSKGAKYVQK
jgi:hypothetical protein